MFSQHFRHPGRGPIAALINYLSNARWLARARRAVLSRLPALVLESDVRDVLYVTWMVDARAAQTLVPAGAVLLEDQGKTPFTILTYRHGNFGPAWLGPLRRWFFPSPLQSNWRLYLAQPMKNADPVSTIVFVQNILDSTLYSVGTRVFSDALLAHLAQRFVLTRTDRDFRVDIEPGSGSAQRLHLHASQSVSATLPGCFGGLFANWEAAVSTVCEQDGAVCQLAGSDLLAFARIDLPIDVRQVQPFELLSGGLNCPLLLTLDAQPEALCFLLPSVRFRVLSERVLHG